jgi:uncharacterized damage-inducible protein DinB
MECRDLVIDALGRVEEDLRRCLDGLAPEQLAFRPNEQANSIAWLAWHLTRVQDDHVSDLAGQPQAWIADGWHAKFDRPADPHDVGFGHTAEQVAAVRPQSPKLLLDYFEAVHRRSVSYLQTVRSEDLDRELDEPQWETPVIVGVRLVSVINDCTQHVGQMAYIRGLIEQRHWLPY